MVGRKNVLRFPPLGMTTTIGLRQMMDLRIRSVSIPCCSKELTYCSKLSRSGRAGILMNCRACLFVFCAASTSWKVAGGLRKAAKFRDYMHVHNV